MAADGGGVLARTEGLRRIYGRGKGARAALDGVSLAIEPGELVCISGPSGCGKSTLLGVVGGLDRGYEGKVELFGRDLAGLGDAELAHLRNARVGFVFQAFHLLMHLTVLENVLAPALFDPAAADHTKRARELLLRLGLADRAADTPVELSGGQRQRVAIARALLMRPALLLCDEPTGNLDRETGAQTIALFQELHRDEQLTIVAATHEDRLANVATRVVELSDGKLAAGEGAAA